MVEPDVARARDSSLPGVRLRYRWGQDSDYEALKQAHCVLPVDYPDRFFRNVLNDSVNFFTVCAVDDGSSGELVGFATARVVCYSDTCYNDQQGLCKLLGSHARNETRMVYILTIGVKPSHRRQGIAAQLVKHVTQEGEARNAAAVVLHVAAYNAEACALYASCNFSRLRKHLRFYSLNSDRSPIPNQTIFDGYLYAQPLVDVTEPPVAAGSWLSRGWAAIASQPMLECFGSRQASDLQETSHAVEIAGWDDEDPYRHSGHDHHSAGDSVEDLLAAPLDSSGAGYTRSHDGPDKAGEGVHKPFGMCGFGHDGAWQQPLASAASSDGGLTTLIHSDDSPESGLRRFDSQRTAESEQPGSCKAVLTAGRVDGSCDLGDLAARADVHVDVAGDVHTPRCVHRGARGHARDQQDSFCDVRNDMRDDEVDLEHGPRRAACGLNGTGSGEASLDSGTMALFRWLFGRPDAYVLPGPRT